MNSKSVIATATIAGSFAAALTMIASPLFAGPKPPQPTMDKCFGIAMKGRQRLRGRPRHHLRRHCERRLPRQRLEVRPEGNLRDDTDTKGQGFARANQVLTGQRSARRCACASYFFAAGLHHPHGDARQAPTFTAIFVGSHIEHISSRKIYSRRSLFQVGRSRL
jgi:hypothetical protein